MFKGQFDLTLFNAGRHKDADFERAIAAGKLDHLLLDCQVAQRAVGRNMLFDNLVGYLFYRLFSGAPTPQDPFQNWVSTGPAIAVIHLNTRSDEPTYTELNTSDYYATYHNLAYAANTGSGSKRLIADSVGWSIWSDPNKEQIFFRTRVLYLPSQGVSNSIYSIGACWISRIENDGTYGHKGSIARIKLHDTDGEPIRMKKSQYQALLVEYTFSMLSL